MNVQEFLSLYSSELDDFLNIKSFEDYQNWHPKFFAKTIDFHLAVKKSYFEEINKIINENNYNSYYGSLSKFSYLGLFNEEDEGKFVEIIRKLIMKLDAANETITMEPILNFLYSFTDFLLHEYYPNKESKLEMSLIELKSKIIETQKHDKEKMGKLIIRFIDLMIPNDNPIENKKH